ncbi:MAG: undecaprenyl-diphosphatase UppP [Patescibacteria group bacterium]|nr:undecaprenyl-diphosphatase UppP [Patescibacteria group bacterium]
MLVIYSIIFGIIQGLTEFLPVSSTGHLVIFHEVWPMDLASDLGFDVILHAGTFFALFFFFYADIVKYLKGFFRSFKHWNWQNDLDQRLSWLIIIGTIPATIIGYFFESEIENQLRSLWVVVVALAAGAGLIFLAERLSRKDKPIESVNAGKALTIGLSQSLALIPGVSRSGITIITGLFVGLKREAAARFAFLLSIPVIGGAGLKKTIDLWQGGALTQDWLIYLVGFLASLSSGYFCVKYFLRYLKSRSLAPFAYYRLILGLVLVVLLLTQVLN